MIFPVIQIRSGVWYIYQTENNYEECYCWPLEVKKEGRKPWCGCFCLVQGSGRQFYWQDSRQDCYGCLLFTGYPCPQVPNTMRSPARSNGQDVWVSVFDLKQCRNMIVQGGTVQITLGAMLCEYQTWVLDCWAELLWIWPKAAAVLPHQSEFKDQSQSFSGEPPKASTILSLELGHIQSLWLGGGEKGTVHPIWVARILLLTLPSCSPTRSFSPSVEGPIVWD